MERHLPQINTPIRACARQTALAIHPDDRVHTARARVLNRDVLQRLLHAPDVYVCIERAGDAVLRVGGPGDRVDARGVVGPAASYHLCIHEDLRVSGF